MGELQEILRIEGFDDMYVGSPQLGGVAAPKALTAGGLELVAHGERGSSHRGDLRVERQLSVGAGARHERQLAGTGDVEGTIWHALMQLT